jgi:hypothetical protein
LKDLYEWSSEKHTNKLCVHCDKLTSRCIRVHSILSGLRKRHKMCKHFVRSITSVTCADCDTCSTRVQHASHRNDSSLFIMPLFRALLRLCRFKMSTNPPHLLSLFPERAKPVGAEWWASCVLGSDFAIAQSCFLTRVEHCKATKSVKHEFLFIYMTLNYLGATHETCLIIDRSLATNVEPDQQDTGRSRATQAASSISLPSNVSQSRSSTPQSSVSVPSARWKAILDKNGEVPAEDRVYIPRLGRPQDISQIARCMHGDYNILNTIVIDDCHTAMSVVQLAVLLQVIHRLAPTYTLRKHQCYWFSLIIFLVILRRTGGRQVSKSGIVKRGKLYGLAPPHRAEEDELVMEDEYEQACAEFDAKRQVSHQRPSGIH